MHIARLFETEPELRDTARALITDPDRAFPLLSAKFKLTFQCNLKCRMCMLWRGPRTRLDVDRVKTALTVLKDMGLRKVHFSGGEVLLYPDLTDVLCFARSLDLQVNLTSNGTLITKELARFFVDQRIHTVTVSVDGPDAETHDRIRGVKGAFKATMTGIDRVLSRKAQKGRGPKLAVNTVVSAESIGRMDDMYRLLREKGIDAWRILPMDTEIRSLRPSRDQWETLMSRVPAWRHLLARLPLDWSSPRSGARAEQGKYAGLFYGDRICYAPWFNLFVDADGRVYPCCTGKKDMRPYGNLNDLDPETILASDIRREIRYSMAAGHLFPACDCCDDFLEENEAFHGLDTQKGETPCV